MRRCTAPETADLSLIYRCPQHIVPSCAIAEKRDASARWPSAPALVRGYPPLGMPERDPSNNFGTACEHPLIPDFPTTTAITTKRDSFLWYLAERQVLFHTRRLDADGTDGQAPAPSRAGILRQGRLPNGRRQALNSN
jgi:hypothetical protein